MTCKALCLVLVLGIVSFPLRLSAQAPSTDPDIVRGIAQVDDGDYDEAILTLDNAARRLAPDKTKTYDLSQAYLYLGIAYIGKGHEAAAKAKFREALAQIKNLSLSPDKFPAKVIDAFEAAREEEAKAEPAAAPAATSTTTVPAQPAAKKKGGGTKVILIVGALAGVGGIAAAAGGGGGGGGTSVATTTTQPADTRQTLNFAGTLAAHGGRDCKQIVATKAGTLEGRLTWTNGQIELGIGCQEHDPPYTQCASFGGVSTRTSNTSATLTVPVTQKTYDVCVSNDSGSQDTYTLVVLFP